MRYINETDFNHNGRRRVGVLLVNLGTPSGLDYFSMRKYLKQFLGDPRVVEMNRIKWKFILNGILLNFIPQRSAKNYSKIWNHKTNKSPLLEITENQASALQEKYNPDQVSVEFAMRYGQPSIESKLWALKGKGCDRILVFPLYPQYSAVTTGSVCDDVFNACKKMRWMPTIRIADPYYDHPSYIEALADSIKTVLKKRKAQPELLITSFHGLPERYFKGGDPYYCHCQKTTRLLKEALKLPHDQIHVTFQSRFGREEWLKPYFDTELTKLVQEGYKDICVITPGFASDCVETLEEVAIRGKEDFLEAGGEKYQFIPCLNDSKKGIEMIHTLVQKELQGWG